VLWQFTAQPYDEDVARWKSWWTEAAPKFELVASKDLEKAEKDREISRLKQRRIIRTASVFLATRWVGPACACRFDVVTILGGEPPEITLLRNAFELPAA